MQISKVNFFEANKNKNGDFERIIRTDFDFDGCEIIKYPWMVWGGVPYGFVRAGNVFYGIVQKDPESIGLIDFQRDSRGKLVVLVKGENRAAETRAKTMKVVVIKGRQAVEKFKKLLPKPKYGVIKNKLFVCTWASLGLGVSQKLVLEQVAAAVSLKDRGMHRIDYFIVDDGYQKDFVVGNDFDEKRFPCPCEMFREIRKLGIKPGIWVAPFHSMNEKLYESHPEWFIGKLFDHLLTRPISWHGIPIRKKARVFDISKREVRRHIIEDILTKAALGVKIIKLDFLYGPMMYELSLKDHTPRFYWHKFFDELREGLPKDIILMGCGVPVADSFEFEVNRTSPDTAVPKVSGFKFANLAGKILKEKIMQENNRRYRESFDTAVLIGRLVNGATMDGIHFDLERASLPLSAEVREGVNRSLKSLKRVGVKNFFIGDDLKEIVKHPGVINFVNGLLPVV